MLTKKTRYAMAAMRRLAKEYGNGTLLINEIAETEKIPKRFLETILLELKNNGILSSKLGKKGGYYLNRKPEDVSVLEIVRLFEGAVALIPCTSEKYYEPCENCMNEKECNIKKIFQDIRDYTYKTLKEKTLADLIS
jgi:Rrf2 family protein